MVTSSGAKPLVWSALGLPLGPISLGEPVSAGGGAVCARGELIDLSAEIYPLWVGALVPRPTDELASWAEGQGVPGARALVDELAGEELIVALPETNGQWDGWIDAHRLVPQGAGLGNRGEDPAEFVISDGRGDVLVAVNLATYFVWAASARTPSLAAAIDHVLGVTDLSADLVRSHVQLQVPWLLTARAAYLDGV